MKIIIAPDKFKGSLTAFDVCKAITAGIKNVDETIQVNSFPMADGGDGFASVMQYYLQTESVSCNSVDPLLRPIEASYQWNEKTKTAIVEMAVASGLVLLKDNERNPLLTTSYGTGLLIKDAIAKGATTIILGLGGSATNDGGTGILEALGFQLLDANNQVLRANGFSLISIRKIIAPPLPETRFELACDVQNLLYGPRGASYVYGPQKGANEQQVLQLEEGLINLATILEKETGRPISNIKGAGAAGGIAASLISYFNAALKSGIDMILSVSDIEKEMKSAQLVITGEGKIDRQSMDGKVIGRIASLAKETDIPAIALCGKLELNAKEIQETGLKNAFSIGESLSLQESMANATKLLEVKTQEIISAMLGPFSKD
jgi:glycerate kinase